MVAMIARNLIPPAMLEVRHLFVVSVLGFVLFGICSGYDYYEEDKRQDLIPLPRVGRSDLEWKEREKPKGLIPFPRVGKRQLVPYPRVGRSFYEPLDYIDDSDQYETAFVFVPYTKRALSLKPRIGRKKRSIGYQQDVEDESIWEENFDRSARQGELIPNIRGGKRSECNDNIERSTRARSLTPRVGRADSDLNKRPTWNGPRVGRALLKPRVGKSDNDSTQ